MMKSFMYMICVLGIAGLAVAACQSTAKSTDIPFEVAENYFVKNDVEELPDPKIETAGQFEAVFGAAATMGKNGMPTAIDFTRQFVIAVALPETDKDTSIKPVSLQRTASGEVVFTYSVRTGENMSFSVRPSLVIIVNKTHDGKVILHEEI
ncbi:hypothetical protein [Sinomicrobium sp. M5D2P9]